MFGAIMGLADTLKSLREQMSQMEEMEKAKKKSQRNSRTNCHYPMSKVEGN